VYSEELGVRSNYAWSPDSKQVLYLQMNESAVPTYPIVDWIQTHPKADPMKYPKAGDKNPGVRLGITGLDGQTKWIVLGGEADIYIPRFGWIKPGLAWAMVLNRQQNRQDLYLIDAASGSSRLVLGERDDFYIELRSDTVQFLKSGGRFLWSSWRDGHTHLYLYSIDENAPLAADAKLVRQITKGEWEFSAVKAVDEKNGVIYFSANAEDARESNLYSIKLDGTALTRITPEAGSHETNISPSVSGEVRYYMDRWSALTVPSHLQTCALVGVSAKPDCHEVWRSTALDEYATLTPQFVEFKAEDGTVLHGVIVLPPADAPRAPSGKYPLIMSPYGGPGAMTVRDDYRAINVFDQVLASKGFAVLKVDNRGMAGRGRKFATVTYKKLGEIELRDQLAALDQALARFPQLDANRLGWWGWSYGGSMTLIAMTHSDRFKVGVAVAPVTDWRFYDSIYTERYMGLPQENAAGYDKSSLVKAAGKLKGNLLIVHGTSDDNVHMQNTLQFVNEMINAGVQFDMQLYPQKTHSISGKKDAHASVYADPEPVRERADEVNAAHCAQARQSRGGPSDGRGAIV
jgi:dipeptidyl-peptidase-4